MVTRKDAEQAVKTLISWIGENPNRDGLKNTPKRVIDSYEEFFSGYNVNPNDILSKTFDEITEYDDMVLLQDMRLESHCEHHMVPFVGKANIAYIPNKKIVGISKIARLVDIFAKRLQTQEKLTCQISDSLNNSLDPKGVMVLITSQHQCMTTRGVHKPGTETVTFKKTGLFKTDPSIENRFLSIISK